MKVTQALLGEHAVFTTLFTHLETRIPQSDIGAGVEEMGPMNQTPLASHAQREDKLLFGALEDVMDTRMAPWRSCGWNMSRSRVAWKH